MYKVCIHVCVCVCARVCVRALCAVCGFVCYVYVDLRCFTCVGLLVSGGQPGIARGAHSHPTWAIPDPVFMATH